MVKLFGTDGIRGRANEFPVNPEGVLQIGKLAALRFKGYGNTVVVGRDTRSSGCVFESCFVASLLSMGMDVILAGVVPTPCVSMLTVSLRCALGVMISASHNDFRDNGIKFFNHNGLKISTEDEEFIENNFHNTVDVKGVRFGKVSQLKDVASVYIEYIKRTFPSRLSLQGLKVVLDCANGSVCNVAESLFLELGANVITINNTPNGENINLNCGALHTRELQERVKKEKADIGIALDGDGDRLVVVNEKGEVVDGDQLIASIVRLFLRLEKVCADTIVVTVASSMALEEFLRERGLKVVRTNVGDKAVFDGMVETDANLGGESSGHVIIRDYAPTSDGLVVALQLLHLMLLEGIPASSATTNFDAIPRILKNVDLGHSDGRLKLVAAEEYLSNNIQEERIVLRKSGTENVIRIIVEGSSLSKIEKIMSDLVKITSEVP